MLLKRAMLSPYPFESLNGSEKCFATKSAKFVFSVCLSDTLVVRDWMEKLGADKHYIMKDGTQVIEL